MSEPMFPSGSGDAAPHAAEPQPSGGSRKALLAVGGAVGALAIGAGAFVLLTGSGGGGDSAAAPVPQAVASAPAPAPSASQRTTTTIKTVSVTARDPFAVLFPAPAPTPAAAPAAPAVSTPLQGPTAAPVVKTTLSVAAVNPTKQTATVSVDGVKYAATVGKVFAKTFLLYSVFNAQCVGVLFGDQSVPVCTNAPQTVSP
ncbi:MAG: hypothetical protein M0Z98_14700 [Actinomycetales bacterium]|nr:hypothetical protein [Actinomycetales bacterium]